jgi:hypothetical protein
MKIYSILLSILLIFIFYILFLFYKKETFKNDIIIKWKNKTLGFVDLDNYYYYNDYYLCFPNIIDSYSSHIHLITSDHIFEDHVLKKIKINRVFNFFNLYYIVKKNYKHSKIFKIDQNKRPQEIVEDMLNNYNSFKI